MLLTINSCFQGSPKSASEHKSSSWSQEKQLWSAGRKYTLFDGLAYNTSRYFVSCVVFFRAPQGWGKIQAMSTMYAHINHWIRGLLYIHYKKKIVIWQFASVFWYEYSETSWFHLREWRWQRAKCSCVLYAKPFNERLIILLQKKNVILAPIF